MSERSIKDFLSALEERDRELRESLDEIVNAEVSVLRPSAPVRAQVGQATVLKPGVPVERSPGYGEPSLWELEVVQGLDVGRCFPLYDRTSLGRDLEADIPLNDQRVSRRHLVVQRVGDNYQIIDQGSSNGTLVNGVLISGPTWLRDGDEILVGDSRLRVHGARARLITRTVVEPQAPAPVPQRTKFCTQCGAPLKAGKRFCTRCGAGA
jgi:hypothetical protein